MGDPLIDLVVAIVALCGMIGVVGLVRSSLYDRIGTDARRPAGERPEPRPGTAHAVAEQELEIRQMLTARSERRMREGQPPLDVEAELARLMSGDVSLIMAANPHADAFDSSQTRHHDPELVEELRQLAEARNRRRARHGEPPLDVRAEVRRALAALDNGDMRPGA